MGKFCREREAAVAERRRALDAAADAVEQPADPQADAAVKLIAWMSGGFLKPAPDDFAMLRLMLLATLPQLAGVLLMMAVGIKGDGIAADRPLRIVTIARLRESEGRSRQSEPRREKSLPLAG